MAILSWITSPTTERLIAASLAPGTVKVYTSHLRLFGLWLDNEERSYETRAERDAAIADYIAKRFDDGVSPAYLRQSVSAIRWAARARDEPDPVGNLAKAALRGASREGRSRGVGPVQGLDYRTVQRAAALAVREDTIRGFRDAAILRCGFDGLLRVSEIARLRVSDFTRWQDGTGRLQVRYSKTDQEAVGAAVFIGQPTVDAVDSWLRASGVTEGPLFVRCHKLGHAVLGAGHLHPQTIRHVIQRRAEAAGMVGRVSGHSLRVGCAQNLARRGVTLPDLMTAGRWTSAEMAAHYIKGELAGRGAVAKLIHG